MNKFYFVIFGILLSNVSLAETYKCPDHEWFLDRKDVGFEHVNHQVTLNGSTPIKELEEAMWFIETVECTTDGFVIQASHIQYGDPEKQTFTLIINSKNKYILN